MNTDFHKVLTEIIDKYGESVFSESKRVSALLADIAHDIPKPQKYALIKTLEKDFYQILKNVEKAELENCKQRLVQKLHKEEGLDLGLCEETIDLLEVVLFSDINNEKKDEQNKYICENCKKEMQAEWKICPFCTDPNENTQTQTNPVLNTPSPVSPSVSTENNNKQYDQLNKKFKKTKTGLIVTIVLSIVGMIIMLISISFLNDDIGYYRRQYNSTLRNYQTLERDHELSKSIWQINITSLRAGNTREDSSWINEAGSQLNSSEIRYLTPLITYNSNINGNVTFDIKVLNPNGTLNTGTSSPSGYSYSSTVRLNAGNDQTIRLSGWGSSTSSTYSAGQYIFEVWYNGFRLISERVTLR